ncbi:Catechol 2,3-dioxygenase [Acinetobacter marinus]|uniref:Catechol 2,3-dioxygenase n=1 Tax=Acinetobacter marinus TaxID=281375 RepID=A0A1G6KWT3_9GAMM|nr:VOC family protein [Acinetobacter marinus]SDC35268.1 Catechol 2,3-dioxygenase [Acinetobacter marinus]
MKKSFTTIDTARDQFGEYPRGINHIGITVPNIDHATDFFKRALGAKWCYDGLTLDDEPRQGQIIELQLGLPKGSKIIRQRMLRLGNGPGLELFEIEAPTQASPLKLSDFGINHMSVYCDDIEGSLTRIINAGGKALDQLHDNSRHEDSEGSSSIYTLSPWGMLIELQSIPNGYYYDEHSEATAWIPQRL